MAVFEKIGAHVTWYADPQKVLEEKDVISVEVQVNNLIMTANGQEILLDVPPMIEKDRTYITLRAIAGGRTQRFLGTRI